MTKTPYIGYPNLNLFVVKQITRNKDLIKEGHFS